MIRYLFLLLLSISANQVWGYLPTAALNYNYDVVESSITRASGALGKPSAKDVFVTGADDIRGLNAKQIAERLTIPQSPTGFRVTEFPTPKSGIASPINRADPGFIGGGRTAGGAREFVIPNGPIPAGATTRVVP